MAAIAKLQVLHLPALTLKHSHGRSCRMNKDKNIGLQSVRERFPGLKCSVLCGQSALLLASTFKQEGINFLGKRKNHKRSVGNARAASNGNMQVDDGVLTKIASAFSSFQVYPPTWSSALAVNIIIFTFGLPLLIAGLAPPAIGAAFVLGTVIWRAFGAPGFWILALYYLIGSAVTKIRMKQKEAEGIAERNKGKRTPASVYGSGAAGFVCALGAILELGGATLLPLWQLGYIASFCTKLADTTSSEVGKAYGKTTYLVTTFEIVPRGTEGAVSVEGTLAGLVGAVFLAAVAFVTAQVDIAGAVACIIAAQIANILEGVIGASLQGKSGWEWLNNDLVNVLNISIGAAIAMLVRAIIPVPLS